MLVASLPGCRGDKVQLVSGPGSDRQEWRQPLSPDEFCRPADALLYAIEAPVGYAQARQKPLDSFALNAKLRWDDSVRPLIRFFRDLCDEHNQARVTAQAFAEREGVLLETARWVAEEREAFEHALAAYAAAERARGNGNPGGGDPATAADRIMSARKAAEAAIERVAARVQALAPGRARETQVGTVPAEPRGSVP